MSHFKEPQGKKSAQKDKGYKTKMERADNQ